MSIRLIAIDIDGTLMPSTGLKISARNCAALQAAEDAGIEIVISTGRREAYAMPLISQVGLSEDSVMISSNGAVVRGFDGVLLDRRFLPLETARALCGALRGYGTLVFTFDREGSGSLVIENLQPLHARIDRWVEANRPYLLEIEPIERAFETGEEPIQGMVCGTVEDMKVAEKQLLFSDVAGQISMHRTEYALRDLSILDLLPPGCSKGAALDSLARIRGLEREQIMAIGDNLNDLEMLEYAGRAVVMANANQELLALAESRGWELTASNDEDGVALAVESAIRQEPLTQRAEGNEAAEMAADAVVQFARMSKMPTFASWLGVLALLGTVPSLRAAEQVTLTNGYNLRCDHQEQTGDKVRLFTSRDSGNFVEVDAAEIASVDIVPDPPPPAVPSVAAEAKLSDTDVHQLIAKAGANHNLDVDLLASVVRAESGGNVRAVSRTGAQGLMQLMPGTASQLGVTDSFRADQNINGGTAYLDALLLRYHDHLALALAAYNAGPAAVDKYHGVPPYRETRIYVARVIREFNRRKQWEMRHPAGLQANGNGVSALSASR